MITDLDIRRTVSHSAFEAGLEYQLEGRVETVTQQLDGSIIAQVWGGRRAPYEQTIRFIRQGATTRLTGTCTCPVGSNCKHVAAALFEFLEHPGPIQPGFTPVAPAKREQPEDPPLPVDVAAWLGRLGAAQQDEESNDYPPTIRKRLLYVFKRPPNGNDLFVGLESVEVRPGGTVVAGGKDYRADQLLHMGSPPKFLRPADRAILRQLRSFSADAEEFPAVLALIFATGRGRWAAWNGPVLSAGDPVSGEIGWEIQDGGQQRPILQLAPKLLPLNLARPWYVNPETGVMGPVETALTDRLIRTMLAAPALPPAVANRVRDEMGRRWPGSPLPPPRPVTPPQELREKLRPRLLLFTADLPFELRPSKSGETRAQYMPKRVSTPLAQLSWQYGPFHFTGAEQVRPTPTVKTAGGVLFEVFRDGAAEQKAAARLRSLGFAQVSRVAWNVPLTGPHTGDLILNDTDPAAWIDMMLDDVPALRAEGWQVDVADDFPLRLAEATGDVSFDIDETSGIGWFDLDLGVVVDGQRISLIPALLDAIGKTSLAMISGSPGERAAHERSLLLPLPDGRLLTLPMHQLEPILQPLLELLAGPDMDVPSGRLRLRRQNAGDLALLEAASVNAGVAWAGGDAVRALGRQLREHGAIPPCPPPASFTATLRPYQADGLAWLQFLRSAGLGGVLADDMGLGKTVQALAHLAVEQAQGRLDRPALVVCPTSLVANWRAEAARFAPSLRTLVLHGPDRAERFGAIAAHDLVITTYPLLARDHAVLTAQDWSVVLLDEAQTIKNPLAATSKLARTLRAGQRLCLSGTPLENHLGELWSLFDFLSPGFLGDRQHFGRRFRTPIEKGGDAGRQTLLAQRIAPFLLRRTKADVVSDLPPKTEISEIVEMEEAQRAIYEGIRLAMHAKVRDAIAKRGLAGSGIVILDALLKLRQACCDPRLLKLAAAKTAKAKSAKLERLLELLPQMFGEGRRVLLFSQFTSMLALIQAELERLDMPYVLLTGDTKDRASPVRQFQAGEVPLFLISLKAGGVGLNLTAADTVIHYDPWWNPAVEDQATDRAHRIGQDKKVFVHRLITAGTIEEKMETLKQRKQALAAGILGATAGAASALTEGDLDLLLG